MGKNIVIGVCGSIAAYKVPSVIRKLQDSGWNVKVVMTESATKFVTPLTFETISKNQVYTDMFRENSKFEISHISLSDFGQILLVIPATANIIGKVACGIADDLLSTTIMAFSGKVVFAPAMNVKMWENPIVQENVEKLKKLGYVFVEPETGKLADGRTGAGRLADIDKIVKTVEEIFLPS
ncbi:MAG: flavoprotein [Candidatus Ratteibacteria bacterium]